MKIVYFVTLKLIHFSIKYSTNSGWATGCSKNEAILHGVNEVIERHYIGELYKKIIIVDSDCNFFRLNQLGNYFEKFNFTNITKSNTVTVVAETIFGSYFCLSTLKNQGKFVINPRGSAVSYDLHHCVERSLFELEQVIELYDESDDIDAYKFLSQFPKLSSIISLGALQTFDAFDINAIKPQPKTFDDHCKLLYSGIKENDMNIFVLDALSMENLFCCSVFIPGLERFNLIASGVAVAPLR